VIVIAESDTEFWFIAYEGNNRHGLQMTKDQKIAIMHRWRDAGLTEQSIADRTRMPRATVHNWLTRRDTNAGRSAFVRNAREADELSEQRESAWHVNPTPNLSAATLNRVADTVSDFLAGTPRGAVQTADVLAVIARMTLDARQSTSRDVDDTISWLRGYHAALTDGIAGEA
jgi:hypothetical protein